MMRTASVRLGWAVGLLASLAACSSTPDLSPEPDAYTWLTQEPRATRFTELVDRAGLADTLRQTRFLTVLVPTNDALATIGLSTPAATSAYPVDSARRLVRYHLLATQRAALNLEAGGRYATRLRDNDTVAQVQVTSVSPSLSLNGNGTLTLRDQFANNATLHLLSRPLIAPARTGTLWSALQADAQATIPRFARLRAALARAQSPDGDRLDTLLQNPRQDLTLLAPTDAAFAQAGFPDNASIQTATPAALYSLLDGHIGDDARFTNGFTGPIPGTVASAFPSQGGFVISSPGTASASLVQPYNALSTNGVLHAVNQVLLP